jgi:hypothetical protein
VASIDPDPKLQTWLDTVIFAEFEANSIDISPRARQLFAFVIQSQAEEQTTPQLQQQIDRIWQRVDRGADKRGTVLEHAIDAYIRLYPGAEPMNVNRAMKLMVRLYTMTFGDFPCGPTGGSEGGSGSGSSGKGNTQTVIRTPEKVGV